MNKYIHYFESENDFNDQYFNTSETKITVTGITCENGETYSYVGPYEEEGYYWVNGIFSAWTESRTPDIGDDVDIWSASTIDNIELSEVISVNSIEESVPYYEEPWVSLIEEGSLFRINYNKTERQKKLETPLTFEITSDGDIVWKTNTPTAPKTIEYKLNDGEWRSITSTQAGVKIQVVSGDIIQFRGNNDTYEIYEGNAGYFDGTTCGFKVKGNIMSLINSTDYSTMTSFSENNNYCLWYMFYNCTGLTDASELMLPATTLANFCYTYMFRGCTSLEQAPELPATTLAKDCYEGMFYGCSSLNYIKCLATDISAEDCTAGWVNGVASTGTFIKDASMTSWTTGRSGIPSGWTVQDA